MNINRRKIRFRKLLCNIVDLWLVCVIICFTCWIADFLAFACAERRSSAPHIFGSYSESRALRPAGPLLIERTGIDPEAVLKS
jgi:hypothetical protein